MIDLKDRLTQLAASGTEGIALDRPDLAAAPSPSNRRALAFAGFAALLVIGGAVVSLRSDPTATRVHAAPSESQSRASEAVAPSSHPDASLSSSATGTVRSGDTVRLSIGSATSIWGLAVLWQRWDGAWHTEAVLRSIPDDVAARSQIIGEGDGIEDIGYTGESFQMIQIPPASPGRYRLAKEFIAPNDGRPVEERITIIGTELVVVE